MSFLAKEKQVILLEEKDFICTENEIDIIVDLHNDGLHFTTIASQIKRDPVEVLLALIHVAEEEKHEIRTLSYAARPKTQKLEAKLGTELILSAKVLKTKKKKPTVLEIEGERYVLENKDQFKMKSKKT